MCIIKFPTDTLQTETETGESDFNNIFYLTPHVQGIIISACNLLITTVINETVCLLFFSESLIPGV